MKKIRNLGLILFTLLCLPFCVKAEEKVTIYFFHGDGCGYCAQAESFFMSLESDEEYKDLFTIKSYETWYNKSNARLAKKAADIMGDNLGGVPYIVIGDKTWNGYDESYGEEMKAQLKKIANDENFIDPLKDFEVEENNTWISLLVIGVVLVGLGTIIYMARKDVEEPSKEENKEEKIIEEPKKNPTKKGKKKKKTATKK